MTEAEARAKRSADDTGPVPASLLGLVTIVGGASTGCSPTSAPSES